MKILRSSSGSHRSALCEHFEQLEDITPASSGCQDCLDSGDTWVHLRLCMTCGYVGCCDASKNKHATRHYYTSEHPVTRSFEPGETWMWCYADQILVR